MEFDKSRVYEKENAGELKIGDKVFVADSIKELFRQVEEEYCGKVSEIKKIESSEYACRFKTENGVVYPFAYLVERAKEKKWRPYKNVDELLSDYGKKYRDTTGFDFIDNALCLPIIWIREKTSPFISVGINGYDKIGNQILFGTLGWCSLDRLFNVAEFLDGTPCGKEIEE